MTDEMRKLVDDLYAELTKFRPEEWSNHTAPADDRIPADRRLAVTFLSRIAHEGKDVLANFITAKEIPPIKLSDGEMEMLRAGGIGGGVCLGSYCASWDSDDGFVFQSDGTEGTGIYFWND